MKLRNILSVLAAGMLTLTACEDEKDLVIYEGDLPIKTSTLYMVGDATPNGWSIDSPTPLTATEEDPLVFTWEGSLNAGEMKLCLTKGSWDVAFIRPEINGTAIDKNGTTDQKFAMHAGDPDDKWVVADAGVYSLTFDLRNWKYSATYVSGPEAPEIEPIEAENLYLVGDASPLNAWNIDNPTPVEKKSQYEFVFEGKLYAGELKACIVTGDWDAPFIRPARADVKINKDGIEENNFVFTAAPDNKWKVEIPGIYRMTFDLKNWTVDVQYVGEFKPASKLYMIGEATEGGWDLGKATEITAEASNDNIFVWEGELGRGTFTAARDRGRQVPSDIRHRGHDIRRHVPERRRQARSPLHDRQRHTRRLEPGQRHRNDTRRRQRRRLHMGRQTGERRDESLLHQGLRSRVLPPVKGRRHHLQERSVGFRHDIPGRRSRL